MTERIQAGASAIYRRGKDANGWVMAAAALALSWGGSTVYDTAKALWDRMGLTAAMEQRIISEIRAAKDEIIARIGQKEQP